MPRAVRLEMAPNIIVKQDIPKLEDLTGGQVLLLGQAVGCSEEFIPRFWWRVDGVEEVENEVMSIDGVLIFSIIYRKQQAKNLTYLFGKKTVHHKYHNPIKAAKDAEQTHPAKDCQEEEMQQPCYHCTANLMQ
ncbi:hypothetical protein EYF80_019416 [Liparis tanakae]|uniref:Uncharacterized protein n=1 Tax=Liparis tanakae TaxID=230148 RepID=A0A4Z2HXY0_9TELE|nr:hypothetical protein EYF80_019416 [Liparis tanakae]